MRDHEEQQGSTRCCGQERGQIDVGQSPEVLEHPPEDDHIDEEKPTLRMERGQEAQGKEKPQQGRVISVGPGKLLENGTRATMSVNVGDVVVFKKYAPDEIKVGGTEFLVISESDVLALVTQ